MYFQFFAAVAVCLTALFGISLLGKGTLDDWRQFATKISLHNETISTHRVGLKYILLMAWDFPLRKAAWEGLRNEWLVLQAATFAVWLVCGPRLRDYELVPFAFILAFVLTAPTFYYYVLLTVPLFFFIPRLDEPTRLLGATLMFGFSLSC